MVAAGFGAHEPGQAALTEAAAAGTDDLSSGTLFEVFKQDHAVTLAQHRSHRSHSSHRSHTSHRSSTGGGGGYSPSYTPPPAPPSPVYTAPPAPPAPTGLMGSGRATPPPRPPGDLPTLSGRSERFIAIVRRVQIALLAQGYYRGSIDGVVGPGTRAALREFQSARGLSVTGTITPQTLDALMIASE
jgi:His-Xaa-Ser repeat protein HxsA